MGNYPFVPAGIVRGPLASPAWYRPQPRWLPGLSVPICHDGYCCVCSLYHVPARVKWSFRDGRPYVLNDHYMLARGALHHAFFTLQHMTSNNVPLVCTTLFNTCKTVLYVYPSSEFSKFTMKKFCENYIFFFAKRSATSNLEIVVDPNLDT
jgi:hypothetical protein